MSDKPTGEPMHGHYCNDPNGIGCNCKNEQQSGPTTGEWTAQDVGEMGCESYYGAKEIADAHNAALATLAHAFESERDLRKRYEDQLAAERELVKKEGIAGRLIFEQLREQLAAERGMAENWKHNSERYKAELATEQGKVRQLSETLFKAVEEKALLEEKVQTLTDALFALAEQ